MNFTSEQLEFYNKNGYIFFPEVFSRSEINLLKSELPNLLNQDSPSRILEKDGQTVRSIYAPHTTSQIFNRLQCHSALLYPAMQLLKSKVYVHQYKINIKAALFGDLWDWHQDYVYWKNEDSIPSCRMVNVAIFLDEVTEFNGPLSLIPGSHELKSKSDNIQDDNNTSEDWMSHLSADLKYTIDKFTLSAIIDKFGIIAPKGPVGSVLFFHPEIVHASPQNILPYDRKVVIVTYNSIENLPIRKLTRPEFLANRIFDPLEVEDALFV